MPLTFTIISTSSSDSEFHNSGNFENNINWRSERNRSFPQSVILELDEESLVSSVTILVDPDYPPSSLTVSLGIPSDHFRHSRGKSYNADYSVRKEISFRKLETAQATVYFHSPAKFIRISIHGFAHSENNKFRQVGILNVEVSGAGEIAPIDSLKSDDMINYVELDRGLLLPLKTSKHSMPNNAKKVIQLYESDSEDEEILFSRDMLNRLKKKEETYSTLVVTPPISVDTSQASTSTASNKSVSPPLSERRQKQILAEISGSPAKKKMESKVAARMSEFNNLERILERKKEAALDDQKYAHASEIDKVLVDLKSRRTGLHELIQERESALETGNLESAEIAKIRFDRNMSDALHSDQVLNVLDGADLARLGIS